MMDLVASLRMKKVRVRQLYEWGESLRKQWEEHFVNHLSEKEKKSIHLYDEDVFSGYLWHVFSYEKKRCLKSVQAEITFSKKAKPFCYVFYQQLNDGLILENATHLKAEDFANEEDIYIVDKKFNWTFVKTHESSCGPYFSYSHAYSKSL